MCVVHDDMCWQSSRWVLQRGFPRIDPRVGKQLLTILLVRSLRDATLSLGARADKKKKVVFFSSSPAHSLHLSSSKDIQTSFFIGAGEMASTLNQLHSTSTSSASLRQTSMQTCTSPSQVLIIISPKKKPLNNAWPR